MSVNGAINWRFGDMELITLVCLVQALILIVVGSVVMLGLTTAMMKRLAQDVAQLAAVPRMWLCREQGHGAVAQQSRRVGQEHGPMAAVRALMSDLLAAASLVGLSGYVAWSAAFGTN
jgi:hypothetical protein